MLGRITGVYPGPGTFLTVTKPAAERRQVTATGKVSEIDCGQQKSRFFLLTSLMNSGGMSVFSLFTNKPIQI